MTLAPTLRPTTDRSPAPTSAGAPVVTVVVPTRHEAGTVDELVERTRRALAATGATYEILFVDDSDDATPAAISVHERAGAPVRLLHRRDGARSGGVDGARCAGFAAARGTFVLSLDGDLRHPPEHLAIMARVLIDRRADVVVATRYVPGGGTEGIDTSWRRTTSAAARDLTRAVLPRLRATTDPGSGFFGFDRTILSGVELRTHGCRTLVELLARAGWERLAEVPYHAEPGAHGRSRTSARDSARYLRQLLGLASDPSVVRAKAPTPEVLARLSLDPDGAPDGPGALVICPRASAITQPTRPR